MANADQPEVLTVEGHEVSVTHPDKLYFDCEAKLTKLDLVRYYLAVAPGALNGIRDRPIVLKRFVNGACLPSGQPEPFYQKRAPADHPSFLRTVTLSFPSGRTADELVVDNTAGLAWIVNLGCIELHPHAVRAADLDHPDELRIDLDPVPGVGWDQVRTVAMEVRAVLEELGLQGWPKTSGSRGMHINVRIHPRWSFTEVRRAALALSREVERRAPAFASSKWWKEERHGVFLDYNQNAKDRTTASAYSVRPLPDARVSAPLAWDEVLACDPADFTVLTMPDRFARLGDLHADMDASAGSLEGLLELAARDEAQGLGDAPWPPHFAKQSGEPKRVQPSKAKPSEKSFSDQLGEGFGAKRFRKRSQAKPETGKDAGTPNDDQPSDAVILSEARSAKSKDPERPDAAPTARPVSTTNPGAPSVAASSPRVGSKPPSKPAPKKRAPKFPLLTVAQSPDRAAAEAGLARWREKHPDAAAHLTPDDILTDRMRGSSAIWYRIRVNLRHVPEDQRPPQEPPDPDDDPTRNWRASDHQA